MNTEKDKAFVAVNLNLKRQLTRLVKTGLRALEDQKTTPVDGNSKLHTNFFWKQDLSNDFAVFSRHLQVGY